MSPSKGTIQGIGFRVQGLDVQDFGCRGSGVVGFRG